MNELLTFLSAAEQENYSMFLSMFSFYSADESTPALQQSVAVINELRQTEAKKFVPHPDKPDPAAGAIREMCGLVPEQTGLLLCTVPCGEGWLSAADDSRYVFCTESQYTVVKACKDINSAVIQLPPGQHKLMIAVFGSADEDPDFKEEPFLTCFGMIEAAADTVTEVVCARKNNFKQLTYHVVNH